MKKVLYIDASFGISGDMLVAALLDMGADYEHLQEVLASLKLKGFATKVSRVKKSGIEMCDFLVELDAEHENHDHDMAYLHGSAASQMAEHQHDHAHEHIMSTSMNIIMHMLKLATGMKSITAIIMSIGAWQKSGALSRKAR